MYVEYEVDVEKTPYVVEVSISPLTKSNAQDYMHKTPSRPHQFFSICGQQSNLSPQSKKAAPVTLFGTVRLGLNSSYFKYEEKGAYTSR